MSRITISIAIDVPEGATVALDTAQPAVAEAPPPKQRRTRKNKAAEPKDEPTDDVGESSEPAVAAASEAPADAPQEAPAADAAPKESGESTPESNEESSPSSTETPEKIEDLSAKVRAMVKDPKSPFTKEHVKEANRKMGLSGCSACPADRGGEYLRTLHEVANGGAE